MKSEDRIVELLSESLHKQDQLADRVDKLITINERVVDLLTKQDKRLDSLEALDLEVKNISFKLSQALDFQRQINNINDRLDRLENAS